MRARSRPTTGWRLLASAWLLTAFFRLALAVATFRRLDWMFGRSERAPPPEAYAARVAAAVHAASRFVPGATCLAQACAARALFSWRGYGVTMRVGIRRGEDGNVVGHAWLLSREQVILGGGATRFDDYRPIADFG